jgi:hypothetical protein
MQLDVNRPDRLIGSLDGRCDRLCHRLWIERVRMGIDLDISPGQVPRQAKVQRVGQDASQAPKKQNKTSPLGQVDSLRKKGSDGDTRDKVSNAFHCFPSG